MLHQEQYPQELLRFLEASPTAFHAVAALRRLLEQHGFRRLRERDDWGHIVPGPWYVTRGDSSLIAFVLNGGPAACRALRMAGAHTDSPALKVKPRALTVEAGCARLGVEVYGGANLATWFDRDCSLAGRVLWQDETGRARASLVDFRRPLAVIPSLAPHLEPDRERPSLNRQTDVRPLLTLTVNGAPDFGELLLDELARRRGAEGAKAAPAEVLAFDLFLYDAHPPDRLGLRGELVCSARLDNLLSCHALVRALANHQNCQDALIALHDHEEVGSVSAEGARGSFLRDVLSRLFPPDRLAGVLARSLFVSADNAHALHPNFAARHDPEHAPLLGGGPVIKINAGLRYATSAVTAAQFTLLCREAGVSCQRFVTRGDMGCGSTIGPLVAGGLGVPVVDVGVPQLAMHSIRETAAWQDGFSFLRAMRAFFAADESFLTVPSVS